MHQRGTIKAPASPHTTRAGEADRDGHPGRVKVKGGGRRAGEGWGEEINNYYNRHHAKKPLPSRFGD